MRELLVPCMCAHLAAACWGARYELTGTTIQRMGSVKTSRVRTGRMKRLGLMPLGTARENPKTATTQASIAALLLLLILSHTLAEFRWLPAH